MTGHTVMRASGGGGYPRRGHEAVLVDRQRPGLDLGDQHDGKLGDHLLVVLVLSSVEDPIVPLLHSFDIASGVLDEMVLCNRAQGLGFIVWGFPS